jgi:integrase/recombinase XerC
VSARKGHLVVRYGKGGRYREVPLHPALRSTLEAWLKDRARWPDAGRSPAVFLNRRGGRLSTRGAYAALAAIAEAAGIDVGREADFTPHVLRHAAGTTLTRAGTDIILVAEILGHSVETAHRYALPTHHDRQAAIERLTTDEQFVNLCLTLSAWRRLRAGCSRRILFRRSSRAITPGPR